MRKPYRQKAALRQKRTLFDGDTGTVNAPAARHLSLFELNSLVRNTIELDLPDSYWVEAELAEARESGGHCYMELVQKDETGTGLVARASAKCWRSTWAIVQPHFERVTGESLHAGMKVLLQVYAQFHESYGFSWIVTDIDPTFTLGDMARKRQEVIRQLKEEGVFDLNKELSLSPFANRIAVISSETAAGYGDFCNQLDTNAFGFRFDIALFPAIMQGERTEQSIISALNAVNAEADDFDCVVIIRGGGAVSDLSAFDSLMLAENVANFPLPVITGIGHERDEPVVDMVAHTRAKTPTAAAALLTDNLKRTYDRIESARTTMTRAVSLRLEMERMRISRTAERIPMLFSLASTRHRARLNSMFAKICSSVKQVLTAENTRIDRLSAAIAPAAARKLMTERHRLELLAQRAEASDPARLLKRGYSITLHNGRAVHSSTELKDGDLIETRLGKGRVTSKVYRK